MRARFHPALAANPAAQPLLADGQLEALKWIALAFMLVDHIGRFWFSAGEQGWVFALGRIAFPLFALVLGFNLGRGGDQERRAARTALRLGLWGMVALLPSVWMRGQPFLLNVLFTLALGACICWAMAARQAGWVARLVVVAIACVASQQVEFELPGVLLVAGAFLLASERSARAVVIAAVLLLLNAWGNARFGGWPAFAGTLAAVAIAAAVHALPLRMPRLKLAFYLAYPLHMALIAILRPGMP